MNKVLIACILTTCLRVWFTEAQVTSSKHCDAICDEEQGLDQVCGTDGLTYASKCEFSNAACKAANNGTYLRVAYYGQCITLSTPCNTVLQHSCPHTIGTDSYVCGNDDRTYTSECALAVARCHSLQDPNAAMEIDLDHRGSCERITNASRLVDCGQYVKGGNASIAIEGGASVSLQIETCTKIYKPVCSLESHSYSNECSFCRSLALRHQITASNLTVYISHDGYCQHVSSISIIG